MTRNLFFHNVASAGGRRFEEMGHAANIAYAEARPRGGMGIDSAEVLPETLAIAVVNFSNEPNTLFQLRSAKPIRFVDSAVSTGLAGMTRSPMKFGALFFDADLDGRPDFFTANGHLEPDIATREATLTHNPHQLFWNAGEQTNLWTAATREEIGEDLFRPLVGRGCAYLDFDGDGDLDLVVTENGGRRGSSATITQPATPGSRSPSPAAVMASTATRSARRSPSRQAGEPNADTSRPPAAI